MFFNRTKTENQPVGLTDGIKPKIDEFVKDWAALKRGEREFVADQQDVPLKLLTDADVTYFTQAMDAEIRKIEDDIEEMQRKHIADVASKDAEIAARNREIESAKARIAAQNDEINRRAEARGKLIDAVRRHFPTLDTSKLLKGSEIRREVVRLQFGDEAVTSKSEAYVDDRYDALMARLNVDPFARVVADGLKKNDLKAESERAYEEMVASLRDAHKDHTKH
jgi:hypothetical protein